MNLSDRVTKMVTEYDLVFNIEPRAGPVGVQVTVRRRGWDSRNYIVKTGGNNLDEALESALEYLEGRG